jgi:hypothetical protein
LLARDRLRSLTLSGRDREPPSDKHPDHDLARFLCRLPPALAASFSAEQRAAIDLHFGMRHRSTHALDWRARFRLPFLSGYIVVLAGRDSRTD